MSVITKHITLINLKHRRIVEQRQAKFIIDEENGLLSYLIDYTCETPINPDDEAMGWQEINRYSDSTVKREGIVCVEIFLDMKVWTVCISINNGQDLNLYFKYSQKDAAMDMAKDLVKFMKDGI